MAGSAKTKIQIFVVDKETEDLVGKVSIMIFFYFLIFFPASWLQAKCRELHYFVMTKPEEIAKLSRDNSREEKERVMTGFLSG